MSNMYIYYQGSDGRTKVLGDSELMHYNHNHDAKGRFAKSNSTTRDVAARYSRINRRQAKIDKLNTKLESYSNAKRMAKAAKYRGKLDQATVKARRAHRKEMRGKDLSAREAKRIDKENKYRAKLAKYSYKNDKWTYKVSKLEYKNYKDAKRINAIVNKYGDVALLDVKNSDRTKEVQQYLKEAKTKSGTKRYIEYLAKEKKK